MSAPVPRGRTSAWLWGLLWAAWLLLFGQQFADAFVRGVPWVIWCGKLLPLLLFVPGMLQDRLRSFIWLCFMTLLYFIALVERLFALPGSPLALAGMVSVVVLFVSAMLYVRARGRELRLATDPQLTPEGHS